MGKILPTTKKDLKDLSIIRFKMGVLFIILNIIVSIGNELPLIKSTTEQVIWLFTSNLPLIFGIIFIIKGVLLLRKSNKIQYI
tara:strand:- start:50601 stop:50849 length:249 start_codon:yes stop_codon:yes gene_type:complete